MHERPRCIEQLRELEEATLCETGELLLLVAEEGGGEEEEEEEESHRRASEREGIRLRMLLLRWKLHLVPLLRALMGENQYVTTIHVCAVKLVVKRAVVHQKGATQIRRHHPRMRSRAGSKTRRK